MCIQVVEKYLKQYKVPEGVKICDDIWNEFFAEFVDRYCIISTHESTKRGYTVSDGPFFIAHLLCDNCSVHIMFVHYTTLTAGSLTHSTTSFYLSF